MTERTLSPELCVVVGAGVLGLAKGRALQDHGHNVSFVDLSIERCSQLTAMGLSCRTSVEVSAEPTTFFLCVPTPAGRGGFNYSALEKALHEVGRSMTASSARHLVVLCSTITPLATQQVAIPALEAASGFVHGVGFDVATMPEFLRNDRAYEDALAPWMTVIAAPNAEVRERLCELFTPFGGVFRSSESYEVAELIKVVHNAYNATKISFFNEVFQIAEDLGVDAKDVSEAVSLSAEASVNPAYGIRGGAPFAGQCLPKDLDALIAFAESRSLSTPMLEATREVNRTFGGSLGG
jgi:UDPglucose 6-dehydrogenase